VSSSGRQNSGFRVRGSGGRNGKREVRGWRSEVRNGNNGFNIQHSTLNTQHSSERKTATPKMNLERNGSSMLTALSVSKGNSGKKNGVRVPPSLKLWRTSRGSGTATELTAETRRTRRREVGSRQKAEGRNGNGRSPQRRGERGERKWAVGRKQKAGTATELNAEDAEKAEKGSRQKPEGRERQRNECDPQIAQMTQMTDTGCRIPDAGFQMPDGPSTSLRTGAEGRG
jgi:hypothetical protein